MQRKPRHPEPQSPTGRSMEKFNYIVLADCLERGQRKHYESPEFKSFTEAAALRSRYVKAGWTASIHTKHWRPAPVGAFTCH